MSKDSELDQSIEYAVFYWKIGFENTKATKKNNKRRE